MACRKYLIVGSVELEPSLADLEEESRALITGNVKDRARSDIAIQDLDVSHSCPSVVVSIISATCASNINLIPDKR